MGYSIILGGSKQLPLASTTGWAGFKRWVASLPLVGNEQIVHLADFGWSQNLPLLATQLRNSRPTGSVASTVADLVSTLDTRDPDDESAFVSNGHSRGDDQ